MNEVSVKYWIELLYLQEFHFIECTYSFWLSYYFLSELLNLIRIDIHGFSLFHFNLILNIKINNKRIKIYTLIKMDIKIQIKISFFSWYYFCHFLWHCWFVVSEWKFAVRLLFFHLVLPSIRKIFEVFFFAYWIFIEPFWFL